MWRSVLVLSVLFTLALGTVAEAKCRVCVDSVKTEKTDTGMVLRFTATSDGTFPETGTAVVMRFDGQQSKCVNVTLRKIDQSGNVATYTGLTNFYGNTNIANIAGRVDIGGDIHEFVAALDGKPGTLQLIVAADSGSVAAPSIVTPPRSIVTPLPVVITPDPATVDPKTAAATAAAQRAAAVAPAEAGPATTAGVAGLAQQPAAWLGLIVIVSALAGAYFDRKRALARATAAS